MSCNWCCLLICCINAITIQHYSSTQGSARVYWNKSTCNATCKAFWVLHILNQMSSVNCLNACMYNRHSLLLQGTSFCLTLVYPYATSSCISQEWYFHLTDCSNTNSSWTCATRSLMQKRCYVCVCNLGKGRYPSAADIYSAILAKSWRVLLKVRFIESGDMWRGCWQRIPLRK